MKKITILLFVLLMLSTLALPVAAAEMAYDFSLTVDGKDTVEVNNGDIITVTLKLRRTDADSPHTVHGLQSELRYDSSILELVEGSETVYQGVSVKDIAATGSYRELYMNFLSMSGGTQWDAETLIGSVQFKVIGDSGVSKITNEDFLVSLPDGSDSYSCTSNEILLIMDTECTVRFMSNGGTKIADMVVQFGEKIPMPENPVRDGYTFEGWYTDIHLSDKWDFETDTIQGNTTLYAKWVEGEAAPVEDAPSFPWWILIVAIVAVVVIVVIILILPKKKKGKYSR